MIKKNKKCTLCGEAYDYCNSCAAHIDKPVWMAMYCSEDCKDIVPILTDYVFNRIGKDEARNILETKDTTRHMYYQGSYGKAYKEIFDIKDKEKQDNENNETKQKDNEDNKINFSQSLAQRTSFEIKNNITNEAKKTYPKAVAHKHGK